MEIPVRFRTILFIPPLLWLTACTVGPDYQRPQVTLPAQFSEAGGEWRTAQPGEFKVPERWWSVFGDAELDRLEALVVIDNQNLKVAEAKYRAARAGVDSASAARFPSVTGTAAAGRGKNEGVTANSYGLAASASWEIDLWGRVRRSIEAAQANAESSADDLAAARLSTQALLAQTWFQLRAAVLQGQLLQRTLAADVRFLELTRDRHDAGVASGLDVALAETQLGNARTQLSENELQRAQLAHALVTLVGGGEIADATGPLPAVPLPPRCCPRPCWSSVPTSPRPNAWRQPPMRRSACARTAYFPILDLGGRCRPDLQRAGQTVRRPSSFWLLGPSLAMTLFDGGARDAAVVQAEAGYDQAVATYRQTVLTAFQEVQDNLAAARLLQREADEQAQALAAARRSREISEVQYRAGTISALNVIIAQTAELAAELSAVDIHTRQLAASVQLLKNAGGRIESID